MSSCVLNDVWPSSSPPFPVLASQELSRSRPPSKLSPHFLPMSAEELHPLEHGTFWKATDGLRPRRRCMNLNAAKDAGRGGGVGLPRTEPAGGGGLALGGVIGLLSFPPRFPPGPRRNVPGGPVGEIPPRTKECRCRLPVHGLAGSSRPLLRAAAGYVCLPLFLMILFLLLRLTQYLLPCCLLSSLLPPKQQKQTNDTSIFIFCLVLDSVVPMRCTITILPYGESTQKQNGCSGSTPAGAAETRTRGKRT